MPILAIAVAALVIFIAIGIMLFSATWAEGRELRRRAANAPDEDKAKARAAHA